MDVSKLKVADLKRELKSRGLSTAGNKQELTERLHTYFETSGDDSSMVLEGDAELEGDEEEDDDDLSLIMSGSTTADAPAEGGATGVSSSTVVQSQDTLKRGAASDLNKGPPKKIVLHRTILPPVEKENLDDKDDDKASQDKTSVNVAKLELTSKERLELRAKKFGTAAADTTSTTPSQYNQLKSSKPISNTVGTSLEVLKKRAERFGASVSVAMQSAEVEERKKKRQERFGLAATSTLPTVKVVTNKTAAADSSTVVVSQSASKRVPITAPEGSAPAADSTTEEKKRLRAERFKAAN